MEKREAGNFFKPVAKSARGDSKITTALESPRVPGVMPIAWPIVRYDRSRESDHRRYHTQLHY
ncbi:MAG: hypothetical protein DMF38_11955 [Verrucomicrobia bacterium]|nr:MAG: hypothetical protein DME78_04340 [Verrucomicrobiota bacterium]PYL33323.1 MAG: hypothetical protein DMF38_11955 [Verrucomicrobiota bacterium]